MKFPNFKRALIVDNDEAFSRSLSKILQKAGYEVNAAVDVKQAIVLLFKEYYPLILLDLKMPGKSGLDLLREITEKTPESKVIIVTAYGELASYREAMDAGAFSYLIKPVKRKEILENANRAWESLQK
ncbi:MAG: response regulator [bacterium]